LYGAGFDILHASLASETVTNYVWGYVIEEQELPPDSDTVPLHKAVATRSKVYPEWKMIEDIMDHRKELTGEEQFDWGLQVIINGLKLSLDKSHGTHD
jgi:hypothetical protein